jgi:anion-transporting  ArsA/GET3 family ATPase
VSSQVLERKLLFVSGKGGVGKTVVSQAIAASLAQRGRRTLWVSIEDPTRPAGQLRHLSPNLVHLNADAQASFEEYIALKIGGGPVTRLFLQNKLIRYLSNAAPGIHELVLLGKIWHERMSYSHVIVDMPSTGYGLAMFQSTQNFARLFRGGPIHRDAESMLATFQDPTQTGHLIVALPEEMPLQESIELDDYLKKLFPANPAAFVVNRRFPRAPHAPDENPDTWPSPVPSSALDYVTKRAALEDYNLRLWRDRRIAYQELDYVPPPPRAASGAIIQALSAQIRERYAL